MTNPVIVGGGLAGLITVLRLAPRPVTLLHTAPLGTECSSAWAQGGIAACVGDDDSPALHAADTIDAGAGLCDLAAVAHFTAAGPAAIELLARLGVPFDSDAAGRWRLGLEAAHRRRRIVHAVGTGSGREIMRAVIAAVVATPSINLVQATARRLLLRDGAIAGVLAAGPNGAIVLPASAVVIATGGLGGLYDHSTNPNGAWGAGLALAARAGAMVADPEFVQFHPTALAVNAHPLPLMSEALRGEGATLIDERGCRFMAEFPNAELAPRDVVARAVDRHLRGGHRVFLDARHLPDFGTRFANLTDLCAAYGVDPTREPIPVRPAAHYHMGGIAVDLRGRSTVPGLWACGEAAHTGLHGANRLASNSLLEAVVGGCDVAADLPYDAVGFAHPIAPPLPGPADPGPVRAMISAGIGLSRDADGLAEAIQRLLPIAIGDDPAADPAMVGLMIAVAAYDRAESRGAHDRRDCPDAAAQARHTRLDWAKTRQRAKAICCMTGVAA